MKGFYGALLALCVAGQVCADEAAQQLAVGQDIYMGGRSIVMDAEGRDDVFLAGERVDLRDPITGSAHLAGRWVEIEGAVAGDVYAMGQRVTVADPVAGDVSAAAQRLRVNAEVGGDLRAMASEMSIAAPIGGNAMLTGEIVEIDAEIAGDVVFHASTVRFGPDARIGGAIRIYEEVANTVTIPDSVASPDQIERRGLSGNPLAPDLFGQTAKDQRAAAGLPKPAPEPEPLPTGFLSGVLVVAILGALLAVIWPHGVAEMRRSVLGTPGRALATGFVTVSAVIGSTILLAMTLFGLFVAPVSILALIVLWVLGYIVGTYAAGVWVLGWFGGGEPMTNGERAMAAGIGALGVGLLSLIPVVGWLLLLVLSTMGAGAVALRILRPRLFADG
ncbi:hypothetical protein [Tropicibacter naphthalenivorans]|uniref:DUF8173 domain-containing protein n=1 Tax=Tropicibacter naphthalenivorans TaxID=441103 RepID=A0A0P1GBB1_9RHOB|nr:hypothetical protein [Tropicibacter naphthalenivorans]CUH78653.1 hypothetical protein TRN7648_02093 [Tropicibacter naphthalenivorans]SMC81134.1 hypothetical protein SAMN04488093_104255 [Tropicibacter naphthalenivorans]